MESDANFARAYRQSRRKFIAACQAAGADAISRVHPAKGPNGKPLFCDSAAFGSRHAGRALLLIGGPDGHLARFLGNSFALPKDAGLVVIHALDPFARAWGRPGAPADWPHKTLAAIAAEDLARVNTLTVLDMDASGAQAALAAALPKAAIAWRTAPPHKAGAAILAAMDAL